MVTFVKTSSNSQILVLKNYLLPFVKQKANISNLLLHSSIGKRNSAINSERHFFHIEQDVQNTCTYIILQIPFQKCLPGESVNRLLAPAEMQGCSSFHLFYFQSSKAERHPGLLHP